ncbi:mitochondrial AAA ATPase [Aspergillus luchuensis]|uniref:Mitochondrial AAA ATPase n=1 Tax=Aspergillus kawachii TaxID=1069201 RepID=A0A146FLT3_ASPKA|nr:mitochondrial AAA ATPase [Aspergillus luchuensis]
MHQGRFLRSVARPCRFIAHRRYPAAVVSQSRPFHLSRPWLSSTPSDPHNARDSTTGNVPGDLPTHNAEPTLASRDASVATPSADRLDRKDAKPYGSAVRRALRNRRPAKEWTAPVATVPDWFYERNTVLNDGKGDSDVKLLQHVKIRPTEIEPEKEEATQQLGRGGSGEDPPAPEGSDTPEDRYALTEALWEELCASARAGLRLPPAKYAQEPSARKSHLVLQYPGTDGILFLDAVVKRLAQELGADLVTLNAQDIAQLCSEQDLADIGTTSPIRSLGYEVYRPSLSDTWQDDGMGDGDAEDDIDTPRSLRSGLRPKFITIESTRDSGDIALPNLMGLKSLVASFNAPADQIGGSSSQSAVNRAEDRRLRLVRELLSSPSKPSKQVLPAATEGEDSAAHEVAEGRSPAVERDVIMLVITPAMKSEVAERVFAEDRKTRILDINIRHVQDLLRTRLADSPSALKDDIYRDRAWPLDASLVKESGLDERYWPYSQVHWATTLALGSLGADEAFGYDHIRRGLEMMQKTERVKNDWLHEKTPKPKATETGNDRERLLSSLRKTCNTHEKKLLNGVVDAKSIRTTFSDVHVPPETIDALKTLTSLSLIRPEAFTYGVLATDKIPGLLLYGPPGTGKTLLAKAVARESGATVLEVSGSEVYDMYVGEGEKNVKAIFTLAKKLSPCVVFIDEADAIFCSRTGASSRTSHRELINQFLREWDGMNDMSAFIMVATNRPFDLDDAVLRRLPRRLLVDLPTEQDRLAILKIHLKEETLDSSVDLAELARRTPLYSGSDLKNLSVAAALACVREENDLAAQHQGEEPYQYPARRTLTWKHFERGMEEISASISEDMSSLSAIRKFDEQYGDRKGRRKKAPGWGFMPAGVDESATSVDAARVRT